LSAIEEVKIPAKEVWSERLYLHSVFLKRQSPFTDGVHSEIIETSAEGYN